MERPKTNGAGSTPSDLGLKTHAETIHCAEKRKERLLR